MRRTWQDVPPLREYLKIEKYFQIVHNISIIWKNQGSAKLNFPGRILPVHSAVI